MSTNQIQLDPKVITWAIIEPLSKQTYTFKKMVSKKGGKFAGSKHSFYFHFPTIEKAKEFVDELKSKGTQFSAVFITDEQFGQTQINWTK